MAAGFLTYKRPTQASKQAVSSAQGKPAKNGLTKWIDEVKEYRQRSASEKAVSEERSLAPGADNAARFGLYTSSISLGLATLGITAIPPLTYACIPTLIYMGIPPAQEAYEDLQKDGHVSLALVETAALGICLAGGYLWVGSLGFCMYYLGRTLIDRRAEQEASPKTQPAFTPVAYRYEDNIRIEIPVAALHKGDRINLESGEMSPVTGVIIEGNAWLKAAALPQPGTEVLKKVGDQIHAKDVISIGRICVQVQST